MPGGFKNKPKILRGAFVEYGLSLPPLIVPFQFNPVQLARNRSISYNAPNEVVDCPPCPPSPQQSSRETNQQDRRVEVTRNLRGYHQGRGLTDKNSLLEIQKNQRVTVQEESISFEIRLDATDKLNDGDMITEQFGLAPQIATLELMTYPKNESLIGQVLSFLSSEDFSFTRGANPPMILFIWGKKVLPVNINSMNITETEFSTDLNPIRATVSVSLTVIEGQNIPYTCSKAMKEAMSVLNLANLGNITDVIVPG